jgi:signal transduction histidine kinase
MEPGDEHEMRRIVHDLRSPLHAVLGFIDLARQDNHDPDVAAHLDRAAASAQHLASLIAELSRVDDEVHHPTIVECGVGELLRSVTAESRVVHGDGHAITVDVDEMADTVTADPHLLRRVLTNLVANALRHTPPGAHIVISVGEIARADGACRRTITVGDDGPGFDPTEPTGRLGLLLVGELVARMDGVFTIDARPGGGTRAVVELPAPCPPM